MGFETFAALLITGALGVGGMFGTFLLFILKGIKANQESIFSWARTETSAIQALIRQVEDQHQKDLKDIRRWVRHWHRAMAIEMIELAKALGPAGNEIASSIENELKKQEDKEFE